LTQDDLSKVAEKLFVQEHSNLSEVGEKYPHSFPELKDEAAEVY
jgi:hypothetical protein